MLRFFRNGRMLEMTYSGAERALSYLSTEVRGLQAAAYILALSSLASSLLALVRDRVLAHLFGAGPELDLYYAAFRIPDLVFIGVGALVSAYVLIPELARRDEQAQRRYIDGLLVWFSALVIFVTALAALSAPSILSRMFPSFMHMEGELVFLTRILLLQAVILGFSNIAAAITQFRHRYALYALSPIVYNLGIIFGALVLVPAHGIAGVVYGVIIGAVLHLGIQLPPLLREGWGRVNPLALKWHGFVDTVHISLPRAFALSLGQFAFFGLLSFAATLPAGSIAVFMFAYNLQSVPLSVIGASYATAAFPLLSEAHARGATVVFISHAALAVRQIFFWSLPALALVIVLRAHIVRTALGSGSFDWTDTRLTAAALALFSLSLASQGVSILLIRAWYAAGRTFVPVLVSAITAGMTLLLGFVYLRIVQNADIAIFLEALLRIDNLVGTDVVVLAFAFSVASIMGAFLLVVSIEWHFGNFLAQIKRSFWESLTAAFTAGALAYLTLQVIGDITLLSTLASVFIKALVAGGAGICAAALVYYLLHSREYAENALAVRRRIWRDVEPIASGEQST